MDADLNGARRDLCRPHGTQAFFPLLPALKRWEKIRCAYGAGFFYGSFHS